MRDVLLFGAGARGQQFLKRYRRRYRIIGFLDNNPTLHGGCVAGLPIFNPADKLVGYVGDIIITSDYYVDIYNQLNALTTLTEAQIKLDKEVKRTAFNWPVWLRFHLPYLLRGIEPHLPWLRKKFVALLNKTSLYAVKSELLPISTLQHYPAIKQLKPAVDEIHVGPHWLDAIQHAAPQRVPGVQLYHFENVQFSTVGRCFRLADGRLVIETIEDIDVKTDYRAGFLRAHSRTLGLVRQDVAKNSVSGILLSCFAPANYYHWMIELLPQIPYINEIAELSHLPILISATVKKYPAMRLTLENALAPARQIIYLDDKYCYQTTALYVVSLPNNLVPNLLYGKYGPRSGRFRNEALHYIREFALALSVNSDRPRGCERIFLARRGILRRYNQDEVITILKPLGFEVVYIEDHPFSEQVRIFRDAQYVVGPTGASWVGLLFMTAGAHALCWMAEEYGDFSSYAQFAKFAQVDLRYMSYRAGVKRQADLYFSSYALNTTALVTWLRQHQLL